MGRGPPPGSGRCFNCGIDGHWARDCNAGDWKNKCYRCGDRGHIERNCQNSAKNLKRGRSYSWSPPPHHGRSRSKSYSRGHSRSHSPRRDAVALVMRKGFLQGGMAVALVVRKVNQEALAAAAALGVLQLPRGETAAARQMS